MHRSFAQPIVNVTLLACLGHALIGCVASTASAPDSAAQLEAKNHALAPGNDGSEGGHAPGKDGPGVTANCNAWTTQWVGPYRYNNNQWGSKKAKAKAEQ